MPFADYEDFDACTRANSDKRDPDAYCAAIKRAVEEADIDAPPDVVHLAETDILAEGLDRLTEERPNEWGRFESEHGVAWVGLSTGATIYQAGDYEDDNDENDADTEQEQVEDFAIDIHEIRQDGDDGPAEDGTLLGLAADMPEGAVYADWNQAMWPEDEQLSGPHVSEYASVEDLQQATGNAVTHVETIGAGGMSQQAEADAVQIRGLSQEAIESIQERYNAEILD
jgi:hypothetical protein